MISGILMNEKPVSKDEIFKELDEYQAMDCCYSDGRILGSMCTEAHPIAKEAFYKFSDSNLGKTNRLFLIYRKSCGTYCNWRNRS